MKLRLVLFSSCTLLFSSLSSLSLNAQQEREARLWLTTALPALAANGAKPVFGPNVLIFDPSMPSQAIQKQIDAVYAMQQHNEFGPQRNALLFLPGKLFGGRAGGLLHGGDGVGRVARCDADCGQRACGCES